MRILEYFQQIYILNLPQRQDRRQEMDEQLRGIGLSLQIPGVRLFEAVRPDSPGNFPSIGARGCFLSHLGMLRDAVSQNFERILIFEDDLNFVPDFNERMTDVIATLKGEDWSMFYGSYAMEPPPQPIAGKALIQIKSTDSIRNSDFVSFRGPAIRQTVSYLETLMSRPAGDPAGGPMHVDGAYGRLRYEFPSIKTMLAAPPLGYQRSSRTDIHPLRWFDRTPVVRQTIGLLRKLRNKK